MKEFFSGSIGSALKTWAKAFLVAFLMGALMMRDSGSFGYDLTTLRLLLDSALFAVIPVVITYFDKTDGRYGIS